MDTEKSFIRWLKESEPPSDRTATEVAQTVAEIAREVRLRGMDAVREYSLRLDGYGGPFETPYETALAELESLNPAVRSAIEESIRNVRRFHSLEMETLSGHEWNLSPGVRAGLRYVPVDSAAVYIPGGRYPLVSSAVMCVVPAQEAGVKRIAAFSPPGRDGKIDATVLAALALLGVREIWAIGGAQAIAAAALGAGGIGKVDFIAGPGNAYVAEAKRAFFGTVGIDGVAGPSEVLILADEGANYKYAARDLLAQSEHDPMARACLVTTSEASARSVTDELDSLLPRLATKETAEASWRRNGAVGIADSLDDAIDYANSIAPEHLQLALANPRDALEKCRSYGAAFLGYSSSEVFGDYIAGTNHTLPTAGRAKFSSGLWTGSFMKVMTHLDLSPAGARRLCGPGETLARTEGLDAHANALRARGGDFIVNGSSKVRDFAVTSMFAAIIFIMTFSPLGFIPLGAMNATVIHVPVIIGAIVMGPRIGAFLGFLFGLASLLRATISPTLTSFVFSPLIPLPGTDSGSLWALLVCFGPRILVGVTPYYADKFFSKLAAASAKWRFVSTFLAGLAGSLTNTVLVMGLIFLIFQNAYASATSSAAELVLGMILSVVFVHGIPEALVAGVFTSAVCRALDSFLKRGGR